MRLRNVPGADAYLTAHPLVIKNETRYRGTWKETFRIRRIRSILRSGWEKDSFF